MASHAYHFITRWRLRGTVKEIADVLADAASLPRWWPSVYLAVDVLEEGHPETWHGRKVALFTKGWLPYTLRWEFVVEHNRYPDGVTLRAHGDFTGRGSWHFRQDEEHVDVVYDWRVEANKPLLRRWSFALKPIFAANHHWAMEQGRISLERELHRRRGHTNPLPPPGPTFAWLMNAARTSR